MGTGKRSPGSPDSLGFWNNLKAVGRQGPDGAADPGLVNLPADRIELTVFAFHLPLF